VTLSLLFTILLAALGIYAMAMSRIANQLPAPGNGGTAHGSR
jgi:hypothetical protein